MVRLALYPDDNPYPSFLCDDPVVDNEDLLKIVEVGDDGDNITMKHTRLPEIIPHFYEALGYFVAKLLATKYERDVTIDMQVEVCYVATNYPADMPQWLRANGFGSVHAKAGFDNSADIYLQNMALTYMEIAKQRLHRKRGVNLCVVKISGDAFGMKDLRDLYDSTGIPVICCAQYSSGAPHFDEFKERGLFIEYNEVLQDALRRLAEHRSSPPPPPIAYTSEIPAAVQFGNEVTGVTLDTSYPPVIFKGKLQAFIDQCPSPLNQMLKIGTKEIVDFGGWHGVEPGSALVLAGRPEGLPKRQPKRKSKRR